MADELTSSGSISELQISETDIIIFTEMPDEVQAVINDYVPLDGNDNTKEILRETFKYLPPDGRVHLVEDIPESAEKDTLRQLSLSIISGLLTPIKVAGATPSPGYGLDESLEEPERQLREAAMLRDGAKCVISGHNEMDEVLEAAHIVPLYLTKWENDHDKHQKMAVWENIFHYFPSVSTQLGFHYQDINSLQNVMVLSFTLQRSFREFNLALEETSTLNEYKVKTFAGFKRAYQNFLPASRTIMMRAHDGRHPLPSPTLLQVHCAIAHILHATGEGEKIEKALDDADAIGGFAASGSTGLAELFSVTELAMVPTIRQLNKHLKLESPKTSHTMESPIAPTQSANTEESKENRPEC
ncbi:hypothetical protein CNMCM5793_002241 [Aspergillus hiratsukae]|uniref:HNH nuclease domain-containing protein n=1 Tax=Aspergillus hiratsukae TaxID=1194566 RepID=A0A8H6UHJ4_9EURO|nr:hypothetical protein CNMCM5793_002241 [Aspergillus hiratsukae]KAF7160708.1 hypothetical protein CNMCM6106_008096 [Aspergillus hiratsukae]